MADRVRPDTLDWALTHIETFGDSDLLPVPFEYEAIREHWVALKKHLEQIDFSKFASLGPTRVLVPKPRNGFRVVQRLHPLDMILYTASVYEVCQLVENRRVPKSKGVACSFRIAPSASGNFFDSGEGLPSYVAASREAAESGDYTHVAIADISDFYNQASLHRVGNALETAGAPSARADSIERFLVNVSAGHSQGIPVGPAASIVLAEAVLTDVDDLLLGKGITHLRYVDDFRVFCKTRADAYRALYVLTEYLHTQHRLALHGGKTKVMTVEKFRETELVDPHADDRGRLRSVSRALLGQYADATAEAAAKAAAVDPKVLSEIFAHWAAGERAFIGLPRHVLRVATRIDYDGLVEAVLDALDDLVPTFRDVAIYLDRVVKEADWPTVLERLLAFVATSDFGMLPFIRLWVLWLLERHLVPQVAEDAFKLAESSTDLGIRAAALLARKLGRAEWVRQHKEGWANHAPWDRRAVIYAAAALPAGERRAWLRVVKRNADPLDVAVAKLAEKGV